MVSGMVAKGAEAKTKESQRTAARKPVVVASMFGNTTTCVDNARKLLTDEHGYEVLVFHSVGTHPPRPRHPLSSSHQANGGGTGTGGRSMESALDADDGLVDGVLVRPKGALPWLQPIGLMYETCSHPMQDLTTTEWADELCGGVFSSGPERLDRPGQVRSAATTTAFHFHPSLFSLFRSRPASWAFRT
jgi:uncharacterized protein (UPF0261 family)